MQKISIVLSVFNDQDNIVNAINSIIYQTYNNIELLVINDCSSDRTGEILNTFSKKDKRIKVFNNTSNLGLTKSLNLLIEESTGDFIARQDSDDISMLNRLEEQISFINNNKLSGCSTMSFIKNTTKIIHKKSTIINPKIVLNFKNPFVHGSYMINKKDLNSLGNYDERFYFAQDYKLIKDVFEQKLKFKILKKPLYVLNRSNNISTNYQKEQKYYASCVRKGVIPNA